MSDPSPGYQLPLDRLYERFDRFAEGRGRTGGGDLHGAILSRLAANRGYAEAAGWTACALERDGRLGRLRLMGLAPGATRRTAVPDWDAGVAEAARAATPPAGHARA